MDGVTLTNSPMFHLVPVGQDITIENVTIKAPHDAPNTDAIDPGGRRVVIRHCTIDTGDDEDRPSWMGTVDFSGLKMKLIASIVAISAIALLRAFMKLSEGEEIPDRTLAWLVGIHLTFVVSGVMLAIMDLLAGKTDKH